MNAFTKMAVICKGLLELYCCIAWQRWHGSVCRVFIFVWWYFWGLVQAADFWLLDKVKKATQLASLTRSWTFTAHQWWEPKIRRPQVRKRSALLLSEKLNLNYFTTTALHQVRSYGRNQNRPPQRTANLSAAFDTVANTQLFGIPKRQIKLQGGEEKSSNLEKISNLEKSSNVDSCLFALN